MSVRSTEADFTCLLLVVTECGNLPLSVESHSTATYMWSVLGWDVELVGSGGTGGKRDIPVCRTMW